MTGSWSYRVTTGLKHLRPLFQTLPINIDLFNAVTPSLASSVLTPSFVPSELPILQRSVVGDSKSQSQPQSFASSVLR